MSLLDRKLLRLQNLVSSTSRICGCNGLYYSCFSVPPADMAPLQYIAPYSGTAMAEYFMHNGKDVSRLYMMICLSMRLHTGQCLCYWRDRRAEKRIRAMCSICILVCLSVPAVLTRLTAAVLSLHCLL